MSNPEHVEWLLKGAAEWNLWRRKNLEIKPDLQAADLSWQNLSDCDLTQADLSHANLQATHVLGANLTQANLTGACIQDWNINADTILDNVVCDYVYLKSEQQERRPRNPSIRFAPNDFFQLHKKSIETIDIIFSEGVSWETFLQSFRSLQINKPHQNLSIQSIERGVNGAFVIRLEANEDIDKASIEREFKTLYQLHFEELRNRYEAQLAAKDSEIEFYRQQNSNMMEVTKILASRPINVQTNINTEHHANRVGDSVQHFHGQIKGVSGSVDGEDTNIFQQAYDRIFGEPEGNKAILKEMESGESNAN
ncbi:MAG: pentapeptide repeat-containing protein [Cyanobacteria bacterium P01_G01_bin.54]